MTSRRRSGSGKSGTIPAWVRGCLYYVTYIYFFFKSYCIFLLFELKIFDVHEDDDDTGDNSLLQELEIDLPLIIRWGR